MKKLLVLFVILHSINSYAGETPFTRGVNLTGWFQTSSARQVQFTKFTKTDFENIKSLGCDVIRLPINLQGMAGDGPDYTIDPLFYYFMDQIIGWAEELNIYVLLDNHATSGSVFKDGNLEASLISMWTQLAEHYKNRSNFIVYEIINEPHDISDSKWNGIQKNVLAAIRQVDTQHTVVVTPAGWGGYSNLKYLSIYNDDNLIYSFHFYDPFLFTHQGASWTTPSMASLAGVPFPYDPARMPECPDDLKGTWVEGSLNNSYKNDGTEAKVKQLIDMAIKFRDDNNVRIFCGEFGVYIPNSPPEDRVRWYGLVPGYLTENNIPWTMWDYKGGFGVFERGSSELFDYDLNIPLLAAMGLNTPEQKDFILEPDTTGFSIFTDYFGQNISDGSWTGSGFIDFYNEDAVIGDFCVQMSGVSQYNAAAFTFTPIKDLSELLDMGYALDLWLKSDFEDMKIDIRFIDTKTDVPEDHPWRMKVTVDKSLGQWDGEWHHLQIPLNDFVEGGSWDNAWFEPQGDFDWTQVQKLEIVSEHHAFDGQSLWIDNVRVVDPAIVGVRHSKKPAKFVLLQNYPNPFNPSTQICYELAVDSNIELLVFNAAGQKVRTLFSGVQNSGVHSAAWNGCDAAGRMVAGGVYFYRLKSGTRSQQRKMLLIR